LQEWFAEMAVRFPPLEERESPEDPDSDVHSAQVRYTFGSDFIYCRFVGSATEGPFEFAVRVALEHRVGVFERGEVWLPGFGELVRWRLIEELEVYFTSDKLNRAAIVRREDGLLQIYTHRRRSAGAMNASRVTSAADQRNRTGYGLPLWVLYLDKDPEIGIYGGAEEARSALHALKGFSNATLVPKL
jgi:hypothetical protein